MSSYKESDASVALINKNKEALDKQFVCGGLVKNKTAKEKISRVFELIKKNGLKNGLHKVQLYRTGLYDRFPNYECDCQDVGKMLDNPFFGKKIAVYTCIFGGYDKVSEPLFKNPNIDYFFFTDQDDYKSDKWIVRKIELEEFTKLDSYHKAKFSKCFPEKILSDYDITVWVDGNIKIVGDIYPIILRSGESSIAIFDNPVHDCIYTEARHMKYLGRVDEKAIDRQISSYKAEGFPEHFGMRETSIVVRKKGDSFLNGLMLDWWNQMNEFTLRDQISLPYILWKKGLTIDYIKNLGLTWRWNPRFTGVSHVWEHRFDKGK